MRIKTNAITCGVGMSLIILLLSLENVSAENDYVKVASTNIAFRYNTEGSRYKDYALDLSYHSRIGKSRWFISQKFFTLSGINTKNATALYSMQGAVLLTSSTITSVFSGKRIWSWKNTISPLYTILSIPSSRIEYELFKNFNIGLSNNTEYMFFRGHSGEKGIFYTPALTIYSWARGFEEDVVAVQLQFGRTYFWNFEGQSNWVGWTIGGEVIFGYDIFEKR